MTFQDHFSGHAGEYQAYRPTYPDRLFDWLSAQAPDRSLAWDCATGNGQAAGALAERFRRVLATDASREQLRAAGAFEGVGYAECLAERVPLPTGSTDLIVVAQALHWFDLDRFFTEAKRVLKPDGVIAAWCYKLLRATEEVDEVLDRFYYGPVEKYWPKERKYVDEGYSEFPFPFVRLQVPGFTMEAEWSFDRLLGYVNTWSSVQRYRRDLGKDPLVDLTPVLREAWGTVEKRRVRWDLPMLVGKKV